MAQLSKARNQSHNSLLLEAPSFVRERYVRSIEGRIAYIRLVNARRGRPLELESQRYPEEAGLNATGNSPEVHSLPYPSSASIAVNCEVER